ncbi:hypothetical protein [Streptomyces sp. YIM S03343]
MVDSLLARGQNVRVRWFDSGCHVADTRRRTQLFGPVPTAEEAVHRLTGTLSTPSA